MHRILHWSPKWRLLLTRAFCVKSLIIHINGSAIGYLAQLVGYVIIVSSQLFDETVVLIIDGTDGWCVHRLEDGHAGNNRRVIDFDCGSRLVLLRIVELVYEHGLWWRLALLVTATIWFRMSYHIGLWACLSLGDNGGRLIATFRR